MTLATIQVKSKAQAVYELLRQRIVAFDYEPGQALSIDGLARELGVSKIPIREAIKQLEAERLVEVALHIGARVAPISVPQAEQIYPIIRALADLAVRQTAVLATDAALDELDAMQRQMEAATRARDMVTVDRVNREFHLRIVQAGGNPELFQLYRDLQQRCSRFRAGVPLNHRRAVAVMAEHRTLLAALRARDADDAVRASHEHDRRSAEEIIELMRRREAARDAV